jgi:hypothetical protein
MPRLAGRASRYGARRGVYGRAAVEPAAAPSWVVGARSFLQGSADTADIQPSGPAGYATGGVYDVDVSGQPLPSGMTLSDAGVLFVGSATAGTTNVVVFGYNEPGALHTLTLHPTATGTLPYMATAYPAEGAVPAGMSIVSADDANLRATVLSTWPDGSAQVAVLAGETAVTNGVQKTIRLRPGLPQGTALTTARISALVTSVAVNFGAGVQTLSSFGTPDRIWWANERVICARYRLSCNLGVMEAVIDIHAFAAGVSNRAFVEVVVENGKTNAAAATVTAPANQPYTGATVSVNGTTIATVSSPTAGMLAPNSRNSGGTCQYFGGHSAFRAWYCAAKLVDGSVTALTTAQQQAEVFGVEVAHDTDSMQAHPWFYKRAAAPTYSLQTKYAQTYDTYVPWSYNRLRFPTMNGSGDDEEIGLITQTQADYVLTGDRYARRAVLATGLAPLSADLCIRHTDGTVPTRAQVAGKNTSAGTWPTNGEASATYQRWGGDGSYIDGSHVPNIALVPFLCRPSPVFIELAQREFLFHHANYSSTDGGHAYDQARARGWRARNMATAIFLTPDADSTRKDGYRTALVNQINTSRAFMDQAWNTYKHIWSHEINGSMEDNNSIRPRFQGANYMHWLIALSWHSIANGKVLRGADQTMMEAAANQVMEFPLRWFNDAASYEWRAVPYQATVGIRSGNEVIPQFSSVTAEHFYDVTGTAPTTAGPWLNFDTNLYDWSGASQQLTPGSGSYYPEHIWFVLCCAVERGAPGAEAAWSKVYGTAGNGGINNISTWLAGHGSARSQLNRFPRGK